MIVSGERFTHRSAVTADPARLEGPQVVCGGGGKV